MLGYAHAVLVEGASILGKTANRAGRHLVQDTPVDTAFARSNWVASIGTPDLSLRAIRSINATVNEIKSVTANAKADEEIPYVKYLNEGSSFQAPANFARISLMKARGGLSTARLLVLRRK
jgi:hypothetical protein